MSAQGRIEFYSPEAGERMAFLMKTAIEQGTFFDLITAIQRLAEWTAPKVAVREERRLLFFTPGGKPEPYIEWSWQSRPPGETEWRRSIVGGLLGRDFEWTVHT